MSAPRARIVLGVLVLAGALLRAPGLWSDFWLDEIWTWSSARGLESAFGVFTQIHDSNNNHLNTLWIHWLGEDRSPLLYRLPAFLAGVASVALAAALAWRRDRLEALFAAGLLTGCFALVHYASEARGYSPAVALALGALLALERHLERPRPATALAFGLCVTLGFLFHLIFLAFWAGAAAWSFRRWARGDLGGRALAAAHVPPALGLAVLAWVDLRHFQLGGGNPTNPSELVARTVGFALGLPVRPALAWPYALLAASLIAAGLLLLWRRGDDRWLLHGVAIVAAPLAAIALLQPQVVAVRYFLIGITLTLLLAARLLAEAWRAGGVRRAVAALLLAGYAAGNLVHIGAFWVHGRGGYAAALDWMASHSTGPEIRVASDHDFRNGLVLRFYARRLPAGRRLVYRSRDQRGDAEWFVVHRAARAPELPVSLRIDGRRFRLVAQFEHAAISGFSWALYRADESAVRRRSSTMPKPWSAKGSAPIRSTRS